MGVPSKVRSIAPGTADLKNLSGTRKGKGGKKNRILSHALSWVNEATQGRSVKLQKCLRARGEESGLRLMSRVLDISKEQPGHVSTLSLC